MCNPQLRLRDWYFTRKFPVRWYVNVGSVYGLLPGTVGGLIGWMIQKHNSWKDGLQTLQVIFSKFLLHLTYCKCGIMRTTCAIRHSVFGVFIILMLHVTKIGWLFMHLHFPSSGMACPNPGCWYVEEEWSENLSSLFLAINNLTSGHSHHLRWLLWCFQEMFFNEIGFSITGAEWSGLLYIYNICWTFQSGRICRKQGAVSIRKTVLPGMAIPMLKIRRPNGRLIFNMEIAICR